MIKGAKGRRVAVFSDMSAPSAAARALAKNVDLLVHEATHQPGECVAARARGHSSPNMAGAVAAALSAKTLVLTHFGRKALDRERASAMWALGLVEAQREEKRREHAAAASQQQQQQGLLAKGSGGGGGSSMRPYARPPQHLVHHSWCGVHSRVGGIFEDQAMLGSATVNGATLDFAFPQVADQEGMWLPSPPSNVNGGGGSGTPTTRTYLPGPVDWSGAAVNAHRTAILAREDKSVTTTTAGPIPIPVICARDFMTVIVQPPGDVVWGAAGPRGGKVAGVSESKLSK